MSKPILRRAVMDDVWRMVQIGTTMHEESSYRTYGFDPMKVAQTLTYNIKSDAGVSVVAEVDGEIVGGMIGYITQHYFGPDKVALDMALFILPEHRKGMLAVRILKAWIEEAKSLGANQISISNSTGVEIDKVKSLYEMVGFKQVGYVFHMGVE